MSLYFYDKNVKDMINNGKLWNLIKHSIDEGYILTANTQP